MASTQSIPQRQTIPRGSYRSMIFVLINGLIVSIAAFLLLHLFVSEATRINAHQQYEILKQDLTKQLTIFNENLSPFSYILKLDPNFLNLSHYIETKRNQSNFPKIKMLYWWPKQDDIGFPGHVIYGDIQASTSILPPLKKIIHNYMSENKTTGQKEWIIPLDPLFRIKTDNISKNKNNWYRLKTQTIAFVYDIPHFDGRPGWMIAIIPLNDLFDLTNIWNVSNIEHLRFGDASNIPFLETYPLTLSTDPDRPALESSSSGVETITIPQTTPGLQIKVILKESRQNIILSGIPNVMLLFGILVTALGTLYVYGNQRQSTVMKQVNRSLALKNLEMNAQVTERERLNLALRRTEQESRAIMNAVSDVIFELDETGRILFLNSCWTTLTGYNIEQTLGSNFFSHLLDTSDNDHSEKFLNLLTQKTAPTPYNAKLKNSDDSTRQVSIRYTMVRQDDPKHPRVVGTITDMDERLRAKQNALEVEEKYRAFWENTPSGIYQIKPDGMLISANPSLARMFGYNSAEEMIDKINSSENTLYPNIRDYNDLIRKLHNQETVTNIERQGRRADGTLFWVLETARRICDASNTLLYIEGSVDDITERKQAVDTLQAAKNDAELANRSKTEFLANMSHELRTPLNAIIGFSEIIKDQILGPIGQEQYLAYAIDIHDSGRNLLSMINTILDVSRIEAGERQLNEDQVHIASVIETVIELLRPKILATSQSIDVDIMPNLPLLLAEELAVKQILLNLVSNAIKFTPIGGHITIKSESDKEAGLRLAITDTGIGLDTDEITRIMAPFGHANGRFDRTSSGPGLGLTLVHALMRLHGGTFDILSQKGVGTTAFVTFPATRLLNTSK